MPRLLVEEMKQGNNFVVGLPLRPLPLTTSSSLGSRSPLSYLTAPASRLGFKHQPSVTHCYLLHNLRHTLSRTNLVSELPGSNDGEKQSSIDPTTKALTDMAQQMASILVRLESLESWPLASVPSSPPWRWVCPTTCWVMGQRLSQPPQPTCHYHQHITNHHPTATDLDPASVISPLIVATSQCDRVHLGSNLHCRARGNGHRFWCFPG